MPTFNELKKDIQDFAVTNGFRYYDFFDSTADGAENMVMFSVGLYASTSNEGEVHVVEGKIDDYPAAIYSAIPASEPSADNLDKLNPPNITVAGVTLNRLYPLLVIERHEPIKPFDSSLYSMQKLLASGDMVSLQLEGNFSSQFTVHATKGKETDALTILTPDVMQYLMQLGSNYTLILQQNTIAVRLAGQASSSQTYNAVLQLLKSILAKVKAELENLDTLPVTPAVPVTLPYPHPKTNLEALYDGVYLYNKGVLGRKPGLAKRILIFLAALLILIVLAALGIHFHLKTAP